MPPVSESHFHVSVHTSICDIGETYWDACADKDGNTGTSTRVADPFTTYRFLAALEASGSIGQHTGWLPHYLAVRSIGDPDAPPMAVAPLYLKTHSQGEYVFDLSLIHI